MKGYPTYASSADYLKQVAELLEALPDPSDRFVEALYAGFEQGRTVFLVGNGGSAANASHFGQDLAKGTLSSMSATRRFRVVPLTDNIGFITALANDEGYDSIFEQQLRNLAASGDLLVAISGSGNSPNVIRAAEYARSIGMTVIGVTGFDGGKLKALADVSVHIPVDDMGMTEALHGVVFHLAMCRLRERLAAAG
ncbi:MAG: SIS domain-containing protein [Myxococcales bacterium]|nr:SIS domain-containing protein [Myxococcales bacterium]